MAGNAEELLTLLYNMVEDGFSLGRNRCVIDRAKAVELIAEINTELPADIEQAKKIVEAKNEIISSAKREAEAIKRAAEDRARQLVSQDEITAEARRKANEMVHAAEAKCRELRQTVSQYVDDALVRTEESLTKALGEVKSSRAQFKSSAK